MRVALINNGTKEPKLLLGLLNGFEVATFPLETADQALDEPFDLIVLSGSSRFPIQYNFDLLAPEMRLIRESSVPMLGICFGHELINVAFGGTLHCAETQRKGTFQIQGTSSEGNDILPAGPHTVYEAHRWTLDAVAPEFEVLATSSFGPEIIRHTSRPIVGFQFHPEKEVATTDGHALFRNFLESFSLLPSSTASGS